MVKKLIIGACIAYQVITGNGQYSDMRKQAQNNQHSAQFIRSPRNFQKRNDQKRAQWINDPKTKQYFLKDDSNLVVTQFSKLKKMIIQSMSPKHPQNQGQKRFSVPWKIAPEIDCQPQTKKFFNQFQKNREYKISSLASKIKQLKTYFQGWYDQNKFNNIQGGTNQVLGAENQVKGKKNAVLGFNNDIEGQKNGVKGFQNIVNGAGNYVEGIGNHIQGLGNTVQGQGNIVMSGDELDLSMGNFLKGFDNKIGSSGNFVWGSGNEID